MSSPSSTDTEEDSRTSATSALEVRLGHLGQGQARQVGVAELEHARAEAEVAAVGAHVAEVDEREQEAARGGAGQAGAAGDVGERELARVGVEGPDDRQARARSDWTK